MKTLLLISCFLTMGMVGIAQTSAFIPHYPNIPTTATISVDALAQYIEGASKNESDKTLLAYQWVTHHIQYSTDSLLNINWSFDFNAKVAATLRRRKGVCDNFASLYTAIIQKMGIPATVVYGMTNLTSQTGHSWVAFFSDKKWWLADPTWDAGAVSDFKYYKQIPENFIQQHWPFDPLWQLLPSPILYETFLGKGKKHAASLSFDNVSDSALLYLTSDSLQQFHAANRRIAQIGSTTHLLQTWSAANRMNIAIIDEARNEQLYGKSVDAANQARELLNVFIEYRNNQFQPSKTATKTKAMLEPIAGLLQEAKKNIGLMGIGTPNYQYDPSLLLVQIKKLEQQLKLQLQFVDEYYKLPIEKQATAFYR